MTESATPARHPASAFGVLLHAGVFAGAGPLIGVLGAGVAAVFLALGLDGTGRSWAELQRMMSGFLTDELPVVLLLAYAAGVGPAALTGAAVGLARAKRPRLTWAVAAVVGLLSPLLMGFVLGYVAPLAPIGLFAALVCTALTYPLARRR